ncbi:hypothetical protein ALP87_200003 [Pseudomonas syringae pv. coriandricola]|nr:hypothetical protein ALP87_200003 [Pseudomonas syringae pv. coriandricola]
MGLSVRIGDESRAILRELARGLLNSLQARVPGVHGKCYSACALVAAVVQRDKSPCTTPAPGKTDHMATASRSAGYWFMNAALCSDRAVNQSIYEPFGKITTMRFSSWGLW